jgi:hypothetical protein
VYATNGLARVAVLPDQSLLMDVGDDVGGRIFESADEYRAETGDRQAWDFVNTF